MVKPIKARKNRRRKPGRKARISKRRLGFPPVISFNKCFMDITLRHVLSFEKQPINSWQSIPISIASLFDGPWDNLRLCFSEVKVKRIHVYAMSGVSLSERGYHALNVAPKAEFDISEKIKFQTLMSIPGTNADRINRTISGVWYPTSTSERLWFSIASQAALVEAVYMSTAQISSGAVSSNFPLEMTIDAHVRVRGVNYLQGVARLEARESEAEMDFVRVVH